MQSKLQSSLVSVIVPMFNAERYISAALRSILQERNVPLEVIVVNDGSTDCSLRKVHEFQDERLRVINGKSRGIASALNAGLAAAQGEFVVRCDADDLYPAGRLAEQIRWLKQHPEFGAVCGSYSAIDPKGKPVIQFECSPTAEDITEELRGGTTRTHLCTYAIRTQVLRSIGGFRPYFITGEDIDLQLRLGEVCRVWHLPGQYYLYRVHNASITHTKSSSEREFFDVIAREFQHQRQASGQDALQRGCAPVPPQTSIKPPMSAAQHIQGFLLGKAWREHREGQKFQALTTGIRSALALPSNLSVWRSLLVLAVKPVNGEGSFVFKSTLR